MIQKEFIPFIKKYSSLYQVEPDWIKAIILTESSGNPYAIRYEGSYPYLFEVESSAKKANVTLATEIASQKISWGLGQIMGALAREQGHKTSIVELVTPEINIKHICIRLEYLKKLAKETDDIFAGYNGGPGSMRLGFDHKYPNQVYVDKIHKNLALI